VLLHKSGVTLVFFACETGHVALIVYLAGALPGGVTVESFYNLSQPLPTFWKRLRHPERRNLLVNLALLLITIYG